MTFSLRKLAKRLSNEMHAKGTYPGATAALVGCPSAETIADVVQDELIKQGVIPDQLSRRRKSDEASI